MIPSPGDPLLFPMQRVTGEGQDEGAAPTCEATSRIIQVSTRGHKYGDVFSRHTLSIPSPQPSLHPHPPPTPRGYPGEGEEMSVIAFTKRRTLADERPHTSYRVPRLQVNPQRTRQRDYSSRGCSAQGRASASLSLAYPSIALARRATPSSMSARGGLTKLSRIVSSPPPAGKKAAPGT